MSPKKRLAHNRSLPSRWRYHHGAYYYRVPESQRDQWDNKTSFLLGRTEAEAYRTWSERLNRIPGQLRNIADLLDRYTNEVITQKAPRTQESNRISVRRLRKAFGHMLVDTVDPHHVYQYMDAVAQKHGPTSANRDLEVFRHSYSKAVQWGAINRNPIKGQVSKITTKPRDRLVTDQEITAAIIHATPLLDAYIRLKLMTGLRRGDLLRLTLANLKDDGIHIRTSKTGKRLIIEWDAEGELKALTEKIKAIPPRRIGDAPLFVTRQGKPYIDERGYANGFDSLWQRFMAKVVKAGVERFQERDLRAKVASDSATLQEASERLGHAGTDITKRVYRRKPARIKPLKTSH